MRVVGRILLGLLVLLIVLAVVAGAFAWWTIQRSFPQTAGTIDVPGLQAPVDVIRDERGVPHIYADGLEDLFFAHGYTHAQDRFYEMDVRRHITSGRLSEMFGETQFETDAFLRTLGWRNVAQQEYRLLNERSLRILASYAEGVNAYLAGRKSADISLEYQLLALQNPDYSIQTWDPVDSVAWLKALAWDLRGNMQQEVARVLSASAVGVKRTEQLYPDYPFARNGVIVSDTQVSEQVDKKAGLAREIAALLGTDVDQLFEVLQERTKLLADVLTPQGEGIGSNSWVVSGELTDTGAPLLANDPHLGPAMPSLWYQAGLHCTTKTDDCDYDVSGFTMAGLPGVFIGHNASIAWGLTNLGPDVTDLVLEQVEGDTYIVDGKPLELRSRTEVINIAGEQPREITVRSTLRGPILSDAIADEAIADVGEQAPVPAPGQEEPAVAPQQDQDYAVALRWTALDPRPTFDALDIISRAEDWREFRRGAELLAVPSQNLVYADVNGNIGYQAPGVIPLRVNYDGRWPVPGWDTQYDWDGYIPFSAMPRLLNPSEGWITTANQAVVEPGYPYPVQSEVYSYGARAQRINERIESRVESGSLLTAADMASIQMDAGNDIAEFLVPRVRDISVAGLASQAGQLFEGWDYQQPIDSAPGAYFNVFYRQLIDRLFNDELGGTTAEANANDRFWEVIRQLWDKPNNAWWDDAGTAEVESRDDTVAASLEAAAAELEEAQGGDPQNWDWGRLHTLTFTNQTLGDSDIAIVEMLLNRGPEATGGGGSIPLATGWDPNEGYEVTWVPSMRQVVDLGDLDRSTWVNLTGNSGHAYHENYGDQIQAWIDGEQYPWPFSQRAVLEAASDTLSLVPAQQD